MEDLLSDPFPQFAFFGRSSRSRLRDGGSKVFTASAPGAGAGPHPVDHERRRGRQPRHPPTHDVRLGAAPADCQGQNADLDASARTPRYRGAAARGPGACFGIRGDSGRRGRRHRRGSAAAMWRPCDVACAACRGGCCARGRLKGRWCTPRGWPCVPVRGRASIRGCLRWCAKRYPPSRVYRVPLRRPVDRTAKPAAGTALWAALRKPGVSGCAHRLGGRATALAPCERERGAHDR